MDTNENDKKSISVPERWKVVGYTAYKLVLISYMLNDMSLAFGSTEIAHSMFYIHMPVYILAVVFIGIPLLYSEICLAQYSNNDMISMWKYFPLFKGFGYGAILLIVYKTMLTLTLAAWYLRYSFYSAIDRPPWYSCDDFPECSCMVKRVNKSIFQHCIEAQLIYEEDCRIITASNCFFIREIGSANTDNGLDCVMSWKTVAAAVCMLGSIYLLNIKQNNLFVITLKLGCVYIGFVVLGFCCSAFQTSWIVPGKADINHVDYIQVFRTSSHGFLALGTGTGVIATVSRDIPFRSPAIMTSIVVALLSTFVSFLFSMIAFSAIMITSYYHGEEDKVIEIGDSVFFEQLGSISEILSYIEPGTSWAFLWFSSIYLCLFMNIWLMLLILSDFLHYNLEIVRKYSKLSRFIMIVGLLCLSSPFFCSDLTPAIADATEVIQLTSSFAISISLYWFYGFKLHAVDIIFMIGVRSSYFWKITWCLNPILVLLMLSFKLSSLYITNYDLETQDASHMKYDELTFYVLLLLYAIVVIVGTIYETIKYSCSGNFTKLFVHDESWGPKDPVLYKSRMMFRPEIMTPEFLYRQVRLYGYDRNVTRAPELKKEEKDIEIGSDESHRMEWSALTSN